MTLRFGFLNIGHRRHAETGGALLRALAVFAVSSVVTFAAPRVRAQSSIELTWDAPAECPQESAVRERLNALSGKSTQARRRLYAEGHIEHVGKRYRLRLSVREGDAVRERTMNADSCTDLAGAAAVALGLLIRNERVDASSESSTSGTGESAEAGTEGKSGGSEAAGANDTNAASAASASKAAPLGPAPSKKTASSDENTKRKDEETSPGITSGADVSGERRWRVLLRAPIGVLTYGRLPKPSGGVAASIGAAYDAWRVNLGVRILETQTVVAHNAYETGARVGHRDLELSLCRQWRDGPVALAPCLIGELQRETSRGSGAGVTPQRQSKVSAVVAGGIDAQWFALEWLSLVASAAVGVETVVPTLQITTAGDVKKLGPLAATISLGPEWIF